MSVASAPRRRRRWPIVLVVVLVVLALLVVAGEAVARQAATGYVRDSIAEPLGVRPSDLNVDLGGEPVLLQGLRGRVTVVTATTDRARLAGVTGSIRLVARSVGVADREAGSIRAEIAVPNQRALTTLVSGSVPVDSVAFRSGGVRVTKTVSILGRSLDLAETLAVSTDGGRIVFTPQRLTVGGADVDLGGVRRGPLASVLGGIADPQSRCIDSALPAGLGLKSARIDGSTLRLVASGIQVRLTGGARGSCG